MFKLRSPSKYSPFDTIHLARYFSTSQNSFELVDFLMAFSASAVSCFTSSTSAKHFTWRTFSSSETKKKVALGEIRRIVRVGNRGHAIFGQTLLNGQRGVGNCAGKAPVMKWTTGWKESSKKLHLNRMQPLTATAANTLIQMGS